MYVISTKKNNIYLIYIQIYTKTNYTPIRFDKKKKKLIYYIFFFFKKKKIKKIRKL